MPTLDLPDLGDDVAVHRLIAARCFNHAWTLMERPDRDEEADRLLRDLAHASRLHWRYAGGGVESARAAWLLSRVHVVLGEPESALEEALASLKIAEAENLGPFDRGFAHEAIARALLLAGDRQGAATARAAGESMAVEVVEDEERDWLRRNLASLEVPPSA